MIWRTDHNRHWAQGARGFRVLAFALALAMSECAEPPPELETTAPPPLKPIEISTVLQGSASFSPSGVAGAADCSIYLVGRSWGTLARLDSLGRAVGVSGPLPGYRAYPSLEGGPDGTIVLWAAEPALLARVGPDLGLDSIPIPEHPWGGRWSGPAVPLADGRIATAPISNRQRWVPSPEPWVDAPLIHVVGADESLKSTAGALMDGGGRYLTWLANRAAIGLFADTLMAIRLSSGIMTKYAPAGDSSEFEQVGIIALKRYFDAPEPREELVHRPWITDGGDMFAHEEVSHVETAAFGADRLYAIRVYSAAWTPVERKTSFPMEGVWQPTQRGLEIYDLAGRRLESLAIPGPVSWMRADLNGRIFLGTGNSILVAQDPTVASEACPRLPQRIDLPFEDVPP